MHPIPSDIVVEEMLIEENPSTRIQNLVLDHPVITAIIGIILLAYLTDWRPQ